MMIILLYMRHGSPKGTTRHWKGGFCKYYKQRAENVKHVLCGEYRLALRSTIPAGQELKIAGPASFPQ